MKKPVIGIALGGGGALGMAHIGVLKALEESGIKPDIIVGTSIGAIVGGFYATGFSVSELQEKALKIKTTNLLDVNFNPQGLLSGRATERTITSMLGGDKQIENLPTKFACVAVDLNEGEEYVFETGSLVKAMRCSLSVPGVFVPVKFEDKLMVDGGVLNNVPANVARKLGADIVIAVNLVSDFKPYKTPRNIVHSVAFSFFIMQKELSKHQLKDYDVLIAPQLKDFRQYTFNEKNSQALIDAGYNETKQQIRKIKYRISKLKK